MINKFSNLNRQEKFITVVSLIYCVFFIFFFYLTKNQYYLNAFLPNSTNKLLAFSLLILSVFLDLVVFSLNLSNTTINQKRLFTKLSLILVVNSFVVFITRIIDPKQLNINFSIVLPGITSFIGIICSILILTNLRKSISEDLFRSSPLEKNYELSNFDWGLITIVSVSNTTIHLLSSNTLQQNLITFLAILIFYYLISINHFIFRTKVKKGIYYIFLAEVLINVILILPILFNF